MRQRHTLTILVVVATELTTALVVLDAANWIRIPVVLAFAVVVPGLGWARRLRLADTADTLLVAITISIGLLVAIGEGMALLRLWSVQGGVLALAAIALLGVTLPRLGYHPKHKDDEGRRHRNIGRISM